MPWSGSVNTVLVQGVPLASAFCLYVLPAPYATVRVPVKGHMPFSVAQSVDPAGPVVTGPV